MFEFLQPTISNDAVALIIQDHETVKALFDQYEKAETRREKLRIAAKTCQELAIHAIIEEEIFYPAVRKFLEKDLMNEADEEHHVARFLVAELSSMNGSEDHYDAKYKVLSENIRHHIKEEERDMLPKVKALDLDFTKLAAMLVKRKEDLKKNGIPASLEDKMVHATPRNDTPARESHLTAPKKPAAKPTGKKAASPAMMKAKAKKAPAKSAGKAAKPAAKTAKRKPALKIVSHRAASASKKTAAKAAPAKKKR